MLKIKNLKAGIEGTEILKGINLEINAGEIHAIMGPNGSGKSTLSAVIAGDENYEVDSGTVHLEGEDLLDLDPDQRAHKGVFLSFQYPVEIPGISVSNFMQAAINDKRKNTIKVLNTFCTLLYIHLKQNFCISVCFGLNIKFFFYFWKIINLQIKEGRCSF